MEEADVESRCPGAGSVPHAFWLVPILADDPGALAARLKDHGFDATLGRSFVVASDGQAVSHEADRIHRRAVYVPVYPAMPDREVRRLARVLKKVVE